MIADILIPIIILLVVIVCGAANNKYLNYLSISIIIFFVVIIGTATYQTAQRAAYYSSPIQLTGQQLEKKYSDTLGYLGISAPSEVEKGIMFGKHGSKYYFLLKERTDLDTIIFEMVKQLKDKKDAEGMNEFNIWEVEKQSWEFYCSLERSAEFWNEEADDLDACIQIDINAERISLYRSLGGRWSMERWDF